MSEEHKFQLNVDGTAVCPFCGRVIQPTHQVNSTKMLMQWYCVVCEKGCVVEVTEIKHVGQSPFNPPVFEPQPLTATARGGTK